MKRTRKWAYVEQEAKRLTELGLTPLQIAKRLGVNKATITRWMASGKLDRRTVSKGKSEPGQTPAQWAATVRKDYDLDATDEQLLTIAERSLEMMHDSSLAPHVRLNAAGRFQSIVRDLALPTRAADADKPSETGAASPAKPAVKEPARRADPRRVLMGAFSS